MNEEMLRKYLGDQYEMCKTALEALKQYGDSRGLKEWFEGRRDMCIIILERMSQ
jgi:hypothetical protein